MLLWYAVTIAGVNTPFSIITSLTGSRQYLRDGRPVGAGKSTRITLNRGM